jgi:hypothetical protein
MWHYAERPRKGPLILFAPVPLTPSAFTESAVAFRSRFQFNPTAHEILAPHVFERVAKVVQTAAAGG